MNLHIQIIFAFIFGCVVGSFLNVIRFRLPRSVNFTTDRSRCPECGHGIAWYDNIPILSFILLRRRCRWCGWKIPYTYVVIEVSTGIAFMLIWLTFSPMQAVAYWILASLLVACAGIDYDRGIIPDKLTFPGLALGLIFSVTLLRVGSLEGSILQSILGMCVGGGSLFAIAALYRLLRKREGMGGGDVMLMAMVGAFLGFRLALLTIFVASFAGALVGLVVARRSREGMLASLRFGVFLAPAAVVSLLWGNDLMQSYIRLIT
jgi:leader peptidase (prepilin peptidase)/N-methyltransferase